MQPRTLFLQNFGPYKNEQIDFSQFYATSLFLISGKTGSGKTTLFDGMCYALYGVTSGNIRSGKEMRADFAAETELTKVAFEFEHQGLFYQIERQPEQIVRKKRGEGTKVHPAKVSLTLFDKAHKEVKELTKQKDVQPFIEELLHLNAAQFCQIVLLPQGEFRRFLNANSSEKEVVLRKLFDTEIFRRLGIQLKEQRKEYAQQLKEAELATELSLQHLYWTPTYQAQITARMTIENQLELLTEQQKELADKATYQQEELAIVRQEKEKIEQEYQKQKEIVQWYAELEALAQQEEYITAEKQQQEERQTQIEQLKWTEKQGAEIQRFIERKTESKQVQAKIEQVTTAAALAEENYHHSVQQEDLLKGKAAEIKQLQQEVNELMQLIPLADKLKEAEELLVEKQELAGTFKSELEQKKESLQGKQVEITALEAEIQQEPDLFKQQRLLREKQIKLTAVEKDYTAWIEATYEAEKLGEECEALQEQQVYLTNSLMESEPTYKQVKSQWASLEIARLSVDLIAGTPCPVCGSLDHPNPHKVAGSAEEIRAVSEQLNKVEEQRSAAQEKLLLLTKEEQMKRETIVDLQIRNHEAEGKIKEKLAEISAPTVFPAANLLKQEQQKITNKLTEIEQKLTDITEKKRSLEEKQRASEQQEQIVANLQREQAMLLQEIVVLETTKTNFSQQIPVEWRELELAQMKTAKLESIKDWETRLEVQTTQKEQDKQRVWQLETSLQQAKKEHTKLQQQQSEQLEKLRVALKLFLPAAKFEQIFDWYQNLAELTELEKAAKAYQRQVDQVQLEKNQLQRKVANRAKPDLSLIVAELAAKNEKLRLVETAVITLDQKRHENELIAKQIKQQRAKLAKEWTQLAQLNQLSEVANGDGPTSKMGLERYVLQSYLAEILEVANQQFSQLTNYRYQFELRKEAGSYKNQTGLEINIYDDYVGAIRNVHTLSGGESFTAALSLSLALAEVVQNQTGGVQMDAMFIDEGFGSLDEEALEMALRALEQIEGKGRMIGIISHVKELKERIPQQLQVLSKGNGQSSIHYMTEFHEQGGE